MNFRREKVSRDPGLALEIVAPIFVSHTLGAKHTPQKARSSGDLSAVEPPVPIPNTEVKRCSPDDSASIGCAKVGRRQYQRPGHGNSPKSGALFFSHPPECPHT